MKQRAFSLIEVIITISIAALIFILISGVYIISQRVYTETDTKAELSQNGRVILDRIVREVRQTPEVVTQLPESNSNPNLLPSEIMFQDGHNTSDIRYIRYFMDGTNLKRQTIIYYFAASSTAYVHFFDTDSDPPYSQPIQQTLDEKIIGEYIDDIEFWGESLININLYLTKNNKNIIINTSVYGRNL